MRVGIARRRPGRVVDGLRRHDADAEAFAVLHAHERGAHRAHRALPGAGQQMDGQRGEELTQGLGEIGVGVL